MKFNPRPWKTLAADTSLYNRYEQYLKKAEEQIGSFLELRIDELKKDAANTNHEDSLLSGLPFAVKDNIAVRGFKLTCASRILEPLVSPYTATAVQKLQKRGAVVIGKTNLDEFGMGSSTDNSGLAVTNNPWNLEKVPGGSSGGSAAAVAAGMVPFAIGTDTGGSIRQPAAFCGVYGLKPTYGSVSRYGLTAYASSLEVIGVISRSVELCEAVFDEMKGIDSMDHSSLEYPESGQSGEARRIGILGGELGLDESVEAGYKKTMTMLSDHGFEIKKIDLPMLDYVVPAYYTIAAAEASANLARFNGVRYGRRPDFSENPEELVRVSRDEGFGKEVKLRVLLGTFVLRSGFQDQYYLRAQKIRTAIRNDFDRIFKDIDLLLMPVYPVPAFSHGESEMDGFQQKVADKFTSTANLAGLPAISFPASIEKGLPVGMQFIAPAFSEPLLFDTLKKIEECLPLEYPPGFSPDWS